MQIPDNLARNVEDEFGEVGLRWLADLPQLLQQCFDDWNLTPCASDFNLSYNYVMDVRQQSGEPAILKVGVPQAELFSEMRLLSILNGHCTVRLLRSSRAAGALLIERVTPGTVLTDIQRTNDESATTNAIKLIVESPVDVPDKTGSEFPTIVQWCGAFDRVLELDTIPLSRHVLDKAVQLLKELESSTVSRRLLHGDLHHENILFDQVRGWLCIDPKGVIGDPVFNAARFLNNPSPELVSQQHPREMIVRRVEMLAVAMNTSTERLLSWAFVDCILSACWSIEAGQPVDYSIQCAEIFESLMD